MYVRRPPGWSWGRTRRGVLEVRGVRERLPCPGIQAALVGRPDPANLAGPEGERRQLFTVSQPRLCGSPPVSLNAKQGALTMGPGRPRGPTGPWMPDAPLEPSLPGRPGGPWGPATPLGPWPPMGPGSPRLPAFPDSPCGRHGGLSGARVSHKKHTHSYSSTYFFSRESPASRTVP